MTAPDQPSLEDRYFEAAHAASLADMAHTGGGPELWAEAAAHWNELQAAEERERG